MGRSHSNEISMQNPKSCIQNYLSLCLKSKNYSFGLVLRTKQQSLNSSGIQSCPALRYATRHKSKIDSRRLSNRIPVESHAFKWNLVVKSSVDSSACARACANEPVLITKKFWMNCGQMFWVESCTVIHGDDVRYSPVADCRFSGHAYVTLVFIMCV